MHESVEWLLKVAGPIIRYRTATELTDEVSATQIHQLRIEMENSAESRKWLSRLRECDHIHSSKTTAAENCVAKLSAFGLTAVTPSVRELLDRKFDDFYTPSAGDRYWNGAIMFPFLVSVGYMLRDDISAHVDSRLNAICEYARTMLDGLAENGSVEDLYLSRDEKRLLGIPKKWQDAFVWKPSLERLFPTCYDFYLFSYLPGYDNKRELILEFASTELYQKFCQRRELYRSYGWDAEKRYCWCATEMPFFHGYFGYDDGHFSPNKFLLYLDLVSRYPGAKRMPWFKDGMQRLERYSTETGRYRFPPEYLLERSVGYYLYAGARMGLGERGNQRFEIESTFRMLSMKRNAGL